MDRFLKEKHRDIGIELKKMKFKQTGEESLIESFIQIIRSCRRFKDLIDNLEFYEHLQQNFNTKEGKVNGSLKGILGLFNVIYSSYTKDGEASIDELYELVQEAKKKYGNQVEKMGDIEILLFILSSSFRYLMYGMESNAKKVREFDEVLSNLISLNPTYILASSALSTVVDLLFMDYKAVHKNVMDVDGVESKLRILKDNKDKVLKLLNDVKDIPHLNRELNVFNTQYNYNDEESSVFNDLCDSYRKFIFSQYGGDKLLNKNVIKPIRIDLLREQCSIVRYDFENQINFGYIDIKFDYQSFTKNFMCNLTGIPVQTTVKKEEAEIHHLHSRLTYTNKLNVLAPNYPQKFELLKLPRFRNYLLKLLEIDPNMDIVNDYEVVAFHQSKDSKSSKNFYRFVPIDSRLPAVTIGNEQNNVVHLMFVNNKRLSDRRAFKVFYTERLTKASLLSDVNPSIYVSVDNDEVLELFIDHIVRIHQMNENVKEQDSAYLNKLYSQLVFTLTSTIEEDKEVENWKKWTTDLKLSKTTPLSFIYDKLIEKSGLRFYDENDEHTHMYLNCYIDLDMTDRYQSSKVFAKSQFENLEKSKSENVVLNTGLSDIFDYVIRNSRINISNAEGPEDLESLWLKFPKYPASVFLPNFLVVKVTEIRKLLDLCESLEFEYIDEKLQQTNEPISRCYKTLGLICAKKKAKESDPMVYYPVLKQTEDVNHFKYAGYLAGKDPVIADVFKINKEFVHFVIFQRREISF